MRADLSEWWDLEGDLMTLRIRAAFVLAAFTFMIIGPGVVAAAAQASTSVGARHAVASQPTKNGSAGQMTRQAFERLKSSLDSSRDLTRHVSIRGGTKTFTYTSRSGSSLVLAKPVGSAVVHQKLGLGGCGWFQVCLYLNRTDQGALAAGAAAGIAAAACLLGGPVVCVGVAVAVAVAAFYIGAHGFCRNKLQVELIPFPGSNVACV
jgi:hypothetical protein